ncbi:T9SS type A sorting domain-containing protein [Polaribacter sp. MSW13]|uniref:T9SS type A sorting domain-containing protein n=1 Tax=Polaribacter marinus TaxID=2916838 RepID=A0A9X2AI46_9FLAO|nr:T9SS type A sorting domain-containing protein [Polaribacter marinus]MCI2228206.1 T9SS type A sorting domain-containing protein [Polaribacter marinus]
MKKHYLVTLLTTMLFSTLSIAQTTVNYPQREANYHTHFGSGGGKYDNGVDELGMWANFDAKQAIAWRNFTDDGTTTGNATTMEVGDTFKISLAAYRAYGQIGISLLSSPTATATWEDRINNYAVQVNLNGNGGAYTPWEIVSNGATVNPSTIYGSETGTINEFVFTFTLVSPTKLEVTIERTNNTATSFTKTVTINNSDISGYSIYVADNWDGDSNQDIFWKPTTEYVYANVWNGSTSSDWETAANWSSNSVPNSATANVRIPSGLSNYPTALNSTTVNYGYIESGATLIAQDAFTGTLTYERSLGTNNWYLISSPVTGETVTDFMGAHTLATGTINTDNRGIAKYINDGSAWNYYQDGYAGGDTFANGQGYSVSLANPDDISFTGTMPINDVTIPITTDTNGFNLVGNPYPSFIAANNNANGTNNVLKINDTDNDFLTESTIWLWNEGNNSYDIVNHTTNNASFQIAPGQGFFVSSNGNNTLSITEAMQSHQGTDTFQRSANTRTEIQLIVSDGTNTKNADIFYIDGTTTGFDNGYDSSIFGGVSHSFAIYTEAVSNGTGKKLGVQSLPNADLETMIIPVGVKAAAGKEITFTAEAFNLPSDIKVFLEDRATNTFTRLDETDSHYTITLNNALNGIGRFYIHTTPSVLKVNNNTLNTVSIFKTNTSTIRINGLPQGKATVSLFNVLGKQVVNNSFSANGVKDISLPKLATGIYIVKLQTETGNLTKKIILE